MGCTGTPTRVNSQCNIGIYGQFIWRDSVGEQTSKVLERLSIQLLSEPTYGISWSPDYTCRRHAEDIQTHAGTTAINSEDQVESLMET